jgi:hypothetical protein
METTEIQERNKQIALMLGLHHDKECVIYEMKAYTWDMLRFHSDWRWLMDAVEFIENKGFPFCVSWNEVFITNLEAFLKQKETGKYDILQPETIIHIYDDEDDKKTLSKKEAVFIAVSDFAKLYNNKQL